MKDDRPSDASLAGLTVISGLVDAISYVGIGQVFMANMTGNLLILGFAAGDPSKFPLVATAIAVVGFFLGAGLAGRLTDRVANVRRRLLLAMTIETGLFAATMVGSFLLPTTQAGRYPLIVALGLAMGGRNTVVRRLKIPDISTTVVTGTLTNLAADSVLGTGKRTRARRRAGEIVALVLGAWVGVLLLRHFGFNATLVVLTVLMALITALYTWRTSPARAR
ncbi:YoaK family protein [Streptosporangium amethystogenes]|uniref:YoaK family protein n=1 Tax=Streptosporangium amethystogenes TaxID=2002 RepID=UPI00146FE93D|nr:YoaK family protein [Streptosporangium amethystogenes]